MSSVLLKMSSVLVAFLLLPGLVTTARAQVPQMMNYQGRLVAGDAPATGDYTVTFALYTAAEGGAPIWSEEHDVTVTEGVFDVLLGSTTPLTDDLLAARNKL